MINANITPRQISDRGGILCLPLVRNFDPAEIKHPDWRIVQCPRCEADCYQSDTHRQAMAQDSSIKALCTMCALREGMEV